MGVYTEKKFMNNVRAAAFTEQRESKPPFSQSAQSMYDSLPVFASFFGRKGRFPPQFIREENGGEESQTASLERKPAALLPGG